MKFIETLLTLLLLAGLASAKDTTAQIKVTGMTCGACAVTVKQVLTKTKGVKSADVSYEKGLATVVYDDSQVSEPELREAINKTGFRAEAPKEKKNQTHLGAAAMQSAMKNNSKRSASASGDTRLQRLFEAVLQYRSDSQQDAVVAADGDEGAYIGSEDGTVTGDRLQGTIRWSLWSGNCLYPLVRKGQAIPDGLHLCTMNPSGFIETSDGARIRFEGRGYGLRSPEKYRTSLTLVLGTENPQYAWLTRVLGVMEGQFDEKAGRATWNVYVPVGSR